MKLMLQITIFFHYTHVLVCSPDFPFRIFAHSNICPVLACCNQPPNLVVISQLMPFGSLYNVLHEQTGIIQFFAAE